jgi:hypothetical protein
MQFTIDFPDNGLKYQGRQYEPTGEVRPAHPGEPYWECIVRYCNVTSGTTQYPRIILREVKQTGTRWLDEVAAKRVGGMFEFRNERYAVARGEDGRLVIIPCYRFSDYTDVMGGSRWIDIFACFNGYQDELCDENVTWITEPET